MVTIGFSKPYVAKYANTGSSVTYSDGMSLGRGVSVSLDVESTDDNNFYADNAVAETEGGTFTGGSATVTVDGLAHDAATLILGLSSENTKKVGGVDMQGYSADDSSPNVGFGCIRQTMMNGKVEYWPIILPKINFAVPGEEAATKEDSIDWQTQELEGTIMRDDTERHNWKYVSQNGLATETAAEDVIKAFLGITSSEQDP